MKSLAVVGMALGLAGALLDFASAIAIFRGSSMMAPMSLQQSALEWSIGLCLLGVVLAVTGVAGISSMRMTMMRSIGFLMLLYGVIMVAVGALMYEGYTPMMANTMLLSVGMLCVGILMFVNGVLMARRTGEMPQTRDSSQSVPSSGQA